MYELQVPNLQLSLHPGDVVKLYRFSDERWKVNFGWFSYGGNKPMNGWYLVSLRQANRIKPLSLSDLEDIYLIDMSSCNM